MRTIAQLLDLSITGFTLKQEKLEHMSYFFKSLYSYSKLDNTLGMLPILFERLCVVPQNEKQESPLISCFVNMKHTN